MSAGLLGHGPFGDAGLAAGAIGALAVCYAFGASTQRRGARRRRRTWAFAIGAAALALAVASPLERLADERFSPHMAQHLLLTIVAAPALALAAVPRTVGAVIAPAARTRFRRTRGVTRWRSALRRQPATVAIGVALVHVLVLAAWHLPLVYEAALGNELVHWAQHVTLLGSAVLLWTAAFTLRRIAPAGAVGALFLASIAGGILGALITFARTPLYGPYVVELLEGAGARPESAAIADALADQQFAGVLMWVPGGAAYLVGVVVIIAGLLRSAQTRWTPTAVGSLPARPLETSGR